MKVQKSNLKFTKSADPAIKDLIEYMIDDNYVCPGYLPMEPSDAIVSANVIRAASINDAIPISEYVKKEFFYNCSKKF